MISNRYGSGKSQELNLKLSISLKDPAIVELMSVCNPSYQSMAELISTSFVRSVTIFYTVLSSTDVTPYLTAMCYVAKFMDANARVHRAHFITKCVKPETVFSMEWPTLSFGLNPLKRYSDMLRRRLSCTLQSS
ncbi:hypothetical protein TNCV_910911 [Trichonephila clavipes]|uniref:Uncharacterized protein n=1 Tax=Trichonephila clavipes TaxID=2585209 RepID=A0A8X6W3Z2_TRICX|nr:hypothetical protein TNCV_910911 [Trichonephila clavipes]